MVSADDAFESAGLKGLHTHVLAHSDHVGFVKDQTDMMDDYDVSEQVSVFSLSFL